MYQWGLCKPQITHFYGFSLLEANSCSEYMVGRHLLNHTVAHSRRTIVSGHAVFIEILILKKKQMEKKLNLFWFFILCLCAQIILFWRITLSSKLFWDTRESRSLSIKPYRLTALVNISSHMFISQFADNFSFYTISVILLGNHMMFLLIHF